MNKVHPHFRTLAVTLLVVLSLSANANAQSSRIKHTIKKISKDRSYSLGRDLWFTMAQNYENQGGKYYRLFVTSTKATTVNIQVTSGTTSKWPIIAGQVVSFDVPLGWEVTTSGVVEDKGIRVWSNDADITAYLLSRNPASSDGMLIIPTTGWGKEYVVGAYASLLEGYGNITYDYPSEFCIVANQNNTVCLITPSVDIRNEGPGPLIRKKGIPFTEILQRGQCVQYQAVQATSNEFDVTGTVVTSNNSIGVVGASQCPNIPTWYPYCDHICDMIPPVRTWGNTYHSLPFANRRGGDTYLVIGSKSNQEIYRNNSLYCVLSSKYSFYFRADIDSVSMWTSDAPFLLAQYINSTTWTDVDGKSNAGIGDPAMVVINSIDQYIPKIIFQTPSISGTGGFTNFCHVMVCRSVENTTLFDGKPITSFKGSTKIPIPNSNYDGFRISNIQPGTHTVVSDSGVGVYVYGYGSYDSYAWSGNLGIRSLNDPDTIPPEAVISGDCLNATVMMKDNIPLYPTSKIAEMKIDSFYNMMYNPDPNYQIGVETDSTFYNVSVIDPSKEAYLQIETHDYAGNRTVVTSIYKPQFVKISPNPLVFETINVGTAEFRYDTICNNGALPFYFTASSASLASGKFGFKIDSIGSDGDIPVGGCRVIKISFTSPKPPTVRDTLVIDDSCIKYFSVLIGSGSVPDFTLSDFSFDCIPFGTPIKGNATIASNFGSSAVTIDSIWLDDTASFKFTGTPSLPHLLKVNDQTPFEFQYSADHVDTICTIVHFRSKEAGDRAAKICGCAIKPAAVGTGDYATTLSKGSSEYSLLSSYLDKGEQLAILPPVPNPAMHDNNSVRFVFGTSESAPLKLSLYNLLGKEIVVIFDDNFSAGIYESRFTLPANLSAGGYIYRLSNSSNVQSGKLVILR